MATDSNRSSATNEGTSGAQAAKEVGHEARQTAEKLSHDASDQVRSTTEYVRDQAKSSVEEGKNQVAQQVGGVARAIHKSSEELRNEELGRLAEQSEWLASRIDELQGYLEQRSASELLNDLRGVARNRPAWYLGGMFAAGLIAARFLHSSDDQGHSTQHSYSGAGSYASGTSDYYRSGETTGR